MPMAFVSRKRCSSPARSNVGEAGASTGVAAATGGLAAVDNSSGAGGVGGGLTAAGGWLDWATDALSLGDAGAATGGFVPASAATGLTVDGAGVGCVPAAGTALSLGGAGAATVAVLPVSAVTGLCVAAIGAGCVTVAGGTSLVGAAIGGCGRDSGCGWTQPLKVTIAETVAINSTRIDGPVS